MNAAAVLDLLTGLARSTPVLRNAACRQHVELFDSIDPADIERATEICSGCLDLQPCRRWAATLPPRSLDGVVGGELRTIVNNRRKS